ncbi:MAG: hypothetical protein DMG87_07425 [Acidobacteria bacterium]|nr:MAG: hypothetical protein DMG87_07425 [Acidobacteriota bacterium]
MPRLLRPHTALPYPHVAVENSTGLFEGPEVGFWEIGPQEEEPRQFGSIVPRVLASEEIFHIPLADIQLSKTNPRQEIDSLANDIKKRGVQEPILVRPGFMAAIRSFLRCS